MWRFFMVTDGKLNSMGRCMKGANAPLKQPEALQEKEWTYSEADGSIYIKIDPSKKLGDYDIRVPIRVNGVSIHGNADHIIVKNLTVRHPLNDGFSMSGEGRNIYMENITAIDCGDDGISAHGNQRYQVKNIYLNGCGTGICDTGNTDTSYENVVMEKIRGVDVFFIQSSENDRSCHSMRNALIVGNGAKQLILQADAGEMKISFDNVLFLGKEQGDRFLRISGNTAFEILNTSLFRLDFSGTGRSLDIKCSVISGTRYGVNWGNSETFHSCGNTYQIPSLRLGKTYYYPGSKPAETEKYQKAVPGDDSVFVSVPVKFDEQMIVHGKPCGFLLERFSDEAMKNKAREVLEKNLR